MPWLRLQQHQAGAQVGVWKVLLAMRVAAVVAAAAVMAAAVAAAAVAAAVVVVAAVAVAAVVAAALAVLVARHMQAWLAGAGVQLHTRSCRMTRG
jgi:hypothetical protein